MSGFGDEARLAQQSGYRPKATGGVLRVFVTLLAGAGCSLWQTHSCKQFVILHTVVASIITQIILGSTFIKKHITPKQKTDP